MAKKSIREDDKIIQLSPAEAQIFDPEIAEEEKKKALPQPVQIKALSKELLRRGRYAVVDRGINVEEFKTRREAYDRALAINDQRGFSTRTVDEIF